MILIIQKATRDLFLLSSLIKIILHVEKSFILFDYLTFFVHIVLQHKEEEQNHGSLENHVIKDCDDYIQIYVFNSFIPTSQQFVQFDVSSKYNSVYQSAAASMWGRAWAI